MGTIEQTKLTSTETISNKAIGESAVDTTRIRDKVISMSRAWKGVSNIHKQTLNSLIGVFSELYFVDEDNKSVVVKCIYGGPERAISRINSEDNIILPIVSVISKSRQASEDKRRYAPVLQHNTYWDHDKQRAIRIVSLAPRAINLTFEINIWGKYVSDINQIAEQVRRKFNPSMTLITPLHNETKAFLESEENEYQIKLGDSDDRLMVKKILTKVETYVPSPMFFVTSTGKIEEVHGEIEIRK